MSNAILDNFRTMLYSANEVYEDTLNAQTEVREGLIIAGFGSQIDAKRDEVRNLLLTYEDLDDWQDESLSLHGDVIVASFANGPDEALFALNVLNKFAYLLDNFAE